MPAGGSILPSSGPGSTPTREKRDRFPLVPYSFPREPGWLQVEGTPQRPVPEPPGRGGYPAFGKVGFPLRFHNNQHPGAAAGDQWMPPPAWRHPPDRP
jgi:hypothetical protein